MEEMPETALAVSMCGAADHDDWDFGGDFEDGDWAGDYDTMYCALPDSAFTGWFELSDEEQAAAVELGWTSDSWSCVTGTLALDQGEFTVNGGDCLVAEEYMCWSYYCDPDTNTCADSPYEYEFAQTDNGEACSDDSDCKSWYCSPAGQCQEFSLGETGDTCSQNEDCWSYICDSQQCAEYSWNENGETCEAEWDCLSFYCDEATSTCADKTYLADGEACEEDSECDSYYCDENQQCAAWTIETLS